MNILDKVDAAQLRDDIPKFRPGDTVNVHVKVIEGDKSRIQVFKVLLSAVRTVASVRPLRFVRFLSVLVWSVLSRCTHPTLTRLRLSPAVRFAALSCTTCVICVVRQPRSRNTASSSAWFLDVIHRIDTTPRFGDEAGRFCVYYR